MLTSFRLPKMVKISGRSSSITNSFVQTLIPVVSPTEGEIREALAILEQDSSDVRCVYCGDRSTEWDHLRPLVIGQRPTGYITEIRNLVPACGKCNQSKGSAHWRDWMFGRAALSPRSRGIVDIQDRARRIERYESWEGVTRVDFAAAAGAELWDAHWTTWQAIIALMKQAQSSSNKIRERVLAAHATGSHMISGLGR